jgi:hypothetical protein
VSQGPAVPDATALSRVGLPTRMSQIAIAAIVAFVLAAMLFIDATGAALIGTKDFVVR